MKRAILGLFSISLAAGLAAACKGPAAAPTPAPTLTAAELLDPVNCQKCHPDAFTDWSGSMHAYASDDPVFLAMEARAQRETGGAIGNFCTQCHAPMAVLTQPGGPFAGLAASSASQDGGPDGGIDVATLPAQLKGVTCFFCHSALAVSGTHDDPITHATDGVMRAGLQDPTPNTAHASAYLALLDRYDPSSASMCGSCHDVVNTLGVPLEQTYAEWQGTLFSHPSPVPLACGECHMTGSQGLAADYPGVGLRTVHSHQFPGVDVALTAFPQATEQQAAVQASLDVTLQAALCVKGMPGEVSLQVVLDNVAAGHKWPSGATQDRRAWVEVVAYAKNEVVYSSGVVRDDESVVALADPDLWLIRDCIFNAQGQEVNMFWEAASHDSNQLLGPVTNVKTDPSYYITHAIRSFPAPTSTPPLLTTMPDRVTMRVRLRPVGLDVLDDLIASGDLDAGVRAQMTTFDLAGTVLEWTAAAATITYPEDGLPVACVSSGLTLGGVGANPAPVHTMCSP
jgi:Cytochrome c554 and c-prime